MVKFAKNIWLVKWFSCDRWGEGYSRRFVCFFACLFIPLTIMLLLNLVLLCSSAPEKFWLVAKIKCEHLKGCQEGTERRTKSLQICILSSSSKHFLLILLMPAQTAVMVPIYRWGKWGADQGVPKVTVCALSLEPSLLVLNAVYTYHTAPASKCKAPMPTFLFLIVLFLFFIFLALGCMPLPERDRDRDREERWEIAPPGGMPMP